jgi:hypothetical protein
MAFCPNNKHVFGLFILDTTNHQDHKIPVHNQAKKSKSKRHLHIKPSKIPITPAPTTQTHNPPIPFYLKSLTQISTQAQPMFHSPHQRA